MAGSLFPATRRIVVAALSSKTKQNESVRMTCTAALYRKPLDRVPDSIVGAVVGWATQRSGADSRSTVAA